jgi:type IV pilus biogenesis protein PilP
VAQPDPELADRRPRVRPEGLAPAADDDAALATDPAVTVVSLRPRERPQIVLAASERARAETEAASLAAGPALAAPAPAADAAEAEAALAAAAAAEAANPSVVAISRRPAARPGDFSVAVEAAVAAAIRAPEPKPEPEPEPEPAPEKAAKKAPAPDLKPEEQDEIDEPEVAAGPAPKIPTKASVAKQATFKNAINLSKINLIGVYGTQSKRYALIRQANGKYKKVKVGDRIDGGRVEAITQSEVRYQKGGRLISLKMPKG